MRRPGRWLVLVLVAIACAPPARQSAPGDVSRREWIQLFNGRDLSDWTPKFAGHPLGLNYNETFSVEDGLLKVRYDKWTTFSGEFGHLFYKIRPFSYYVIAVEYRFVGNQVRGAGSGLSWAIRNNGVMIHSQSPESMAIGQSFPISLEVQLLGGLSNGSPRATANLCTPGTHVVMQGVLVTQHCVNSRSRTYEGDQWVRVEAYVLGDSLIRHVVNGDTVLAYSRPQMGGGMADDAAPGVLQEGSLLGGGYIALQAETAPIDFRKVDILNLEGCTDASAANYKSYYVKSDSASCAYGTQRARR